MVKILKCFSKNKGMTINELLVSSIIGVIAIGIVLGMWYFTYKIWSTERAKSSMRIDLEVSMERIKNEARLSSLNYISFYPANSIVYSAISIPVAKKEASDNRFLDLDASGYIIFDKSVIYHVFENPADSGEYELRRTEFTDNESVLADSAKLLNQLTSVVTNGDGSAWNSGGTWIEGQTKTLCKYVKTFAIKPKFQLFDGYSSTPSRSDWVDFGSIRLTSGNHYFKFEVVGTSGTGYKFGIDTLSISPSGCQREAEFYYPLDSPHSHSGGTASIKDDVGNCSGGHYLEYSSGDVMDYIDLELYNDLWRNSHFEQASKDNTILTEGLSIQLNTPKEGGGSCWAATNEASSTVVIDSFTTEPGAGITIRNILSDANIEQRGDLVRVKFLNPSSTVSFQINEAYILKRLSGDDGSGSSMQLWFSDNPLIIGEEEPGTYGLKIGDDLGNASPSRALVAGDPGKYAWSNWAVFPIEADTSDYFITLHVDNGIPLATQINVTGWEGQELNSYWVEGNVALMEGWASSTESNNIYCAESGENWPQYGTARSGTYDTEIDDPQYDEINWQPTASPSGSNIDVSARSSDSADMSGATSWKTVTTSGGSLTGIDGGRYVEFEATLEKTSGYDDYTNYPWIDDVTINWPGESILCRIGGYFIRKPDYGIIKLTIDDRDLTKGLEFSIALSKDILPGETYETSLVADVEPRNTGR